MSQLVAPTTTEAPAGRRPRSRTFRYVRALLSAGVAVVIFALVIPKIASYSTVWRSLTGLGPVQFAEVVGAMLFNLVTYWWQMQAAMPGLSLGQAAVNNQTGTTISNVVPGGGVIAIGVVIQMFRSWGFTGSQIGLELSTTGIWNSFLKLGLPVVALALLAITGKATTALLVPALVGLVILAGSLLLFALLLWRKRFARAIGGGLGRAWSWGRRLFRKPAVHWGDAAVRFRKQTIQLISKRWHVLTVTTVVSHLALFFVLLLSLRVLGVQEHEVSWAQALAVFAFARLLSAAPITPGGVGFVELALIAGLYAAGRNHADVPLPQFRAQITAATLLYRGLTYGVQIPFGAFTYIIWRRNRRWLKPQPEEPSTSSGVNQGAR